MVNLSFSFFAEFGMLFDFVESTNIKPLTLIFDTWSVKKDAKHLGVTKSQVKMARKIKRNVSQPFFTDQVSEIKVKGLILVLWLAWYTFSLKTWPSQSECSNFFLTFFCNTGCSKSLGHILTLNILETIKDIKSHLINSESL